VPSSEQPRQQATGVDARLTRPGKLSYIQVPARDTAAAAAFYRDVFGWTISGDNPDHRSFADASGDLIGAFVTGRAASSEPGILPYISVDDIDAAVAKILESGGHVVREPYPEGDLRVATFRDPAGNVVGIWQAPH